MMISVVWRVFEKGESIVFFGCDDVLLSLCVY